LKENRQERIDQHRQSMITGGEDCFEIYANAAVAANEEPFIPGINEIMPPPVCPRTLVVEKLQVFYYRFANKDSFKACAKSLTETLISKAPPDASKFVDERIQLLFADNTTLVTDDDQWSHLW